MKKIFTLLSLAFVAVSASASVTIYFKPNSNWAGNSDRVSIYYWNDSSNGWVSMESADATDFVDWSGWYKAEIDNTTYTNFKFVSMNKNTSENNWDNRWSEGGNLLIPSSTTLYQDETSEWNNNTTYANPTLNDYSVSFFNDDSWGYVLAYFFNSEAVGNAWPGIEISQTANLSGWQEKNGYLHEVFNYNFKAITLPQYVIFNNQKDQDGKLQTKNLPLTDGKEFTSGYHDYRLIGGVGNAQWSIGQTLTYADGVHSVEINNNPDYRFAIVAERWLAPDNSYLDGRDVNGTWTAWWDKLQHNNGEAKYVSFAESNGSIFEDENSYNWNIADNNDAKINFNYNEQSGTWSISQTDAVAVGEAGWASYSNSYNFKADKTAYVISSIANGYAKLTAVEAGTTIGAGAGVLFKESATITPATGEAYSSINKLSGSGNDELTINTNDLVLGVSGDVTGFYKLSTTTLAAHKAYLKAADAAGANAISLVFDDEQTGISTVATDRREQTIYSVQGVRRQNMKKGLNIVGGKKVLVK